MTERDFKGIWIPKEIWLSKDLTMKEKIFLIEIDSLDNEFGCFASNTYFSEFFGISKSRCSQVIKSLEEKGFIICKYEMDGKTIKSREIRVVRKPNDLFMKSNQPIKETKQGCLENLKDNNTLFNNTINNINNMSSATKSDKEIPYDDIVNYLNERVGGQYKASTKLTRDKIKARWHEGYRLADFKKVIDNKVMNWTNTDFEQYLQPKTLFGPKFEGYLNEKPHVKKNQFTNSWDSQPIDLDKLKPVEGLTQEVLSL